ncbi:MAG: hypothetical protein B7Z59_13300 [Acidiphilium sp. 37-67-22]|nr:MAG: hypothetical protein B7Z59_13300 [Acidiphilium sp. 37-67-22]
MRTARCVSLIRTAALLAGLAAGLWQPGAAHAAAPTAPDGKLARLRLIALPDAALARTTGEGFVAPPIAIRLPDRGRVTLWDELAARPGDVGLPSGQVTVMVNSR